MAKVLVTYSNEDDDEWESYPDIFDSLEEAEEYVEKYGYQWGNTSVEFWEKIDD